MLTKLSHRYVCDVANEIKCGRSNNSKKCCKNCCNVELYSNENPKRYNCPIIANLAKKANPIIDTIKVEVLPNYACTRWKKKK